MKKTVCLADDEPEVRDYLSLALKCKGFAVEALEDGEELLKNLKSRPGASAVLLDISMPRKNGIATLREIREMHPEMPVIMISGSSAPSNVVEAMRMGATDFLGKPFSNEDLNEVLDRVISQRESVAPDSFTPAKPCGKSKAFVSANPRMQEIESIVDSVGWSDVPVLIQGETGVGKEVLALSLHERSQRARQPFVKLNCAALPSELVESELFGYERGAFTGAYQEKPGMFERADGGTIFLDEIGDMDYKLQAKLLQVLQDHSFQRLGGKRTTHVNVRVICATHRDLEKAVEEGKFRQDLYYRLNVIDLRLPALRERKEDILGLAEVLLSKHAPAGTPLPTISASLKQALLSYDWPGNVRELENVMRKLWVYQNGEIIALELRSRMARRIQEAHVPAAATSTNLNEAVLDQVTKAKDRAEVEAIVAALDATSWNRRRAALLLKTDYKGLLYKIRKLGIEARSVS